MPAWPPAGRLRGDGRRGFLGGLAGVAQHPDILAAAALLHRDDFRVIVGGETGEPAGHHAIASGRRDGVDADAERARRKAVGVLGVPHRRLREGQMLLRDVGVRPSAHPRDQLGALLGGQVAAEHGSPALIGKRGLDHEARELLDHGLECGPLAAPPGGDRRQRQALADERFGEGGQKAEPRGRLHHAAARARWRRPRFPCGWRRAIRARPARNRRAAPPDRRNRRRVVGTPHARASGPTSVFRNTVSSRTVRSCPSTRGKPSWRAR